MNANELMIGDWVQVPSELNRYKMLRSTFDMDEAILYEPIPLTPEILKKNGFSVNYHEDDLCYAQSCGDVIGIHIYGTNGLMEEMYFKYVHELQHALRLCGIEKEIIL